MNKDTSRTSENHVKKIEIYLMPFKILSKRVSIKEFDKCYFFKLIEKHEPNEVLTEFLNIIPKLEESEFKSVGNIRMKCILYFNKKKKTTIYISFEQRIQIGETIYKPNPEFIKYFLKHFSTNYYPPSFLDRGDVMWR